MRRVARERDRLTARIDSAEQQLERYRFMVRALLALHPAVDPACPTVETRRHGRECVVHAIAAGHVTANSGPHAIVPTATR